MKLISGLRGIRFLVKKEQSSCTLYAPAADPEEAGFCLCWTHDVVTVFKVGSSEVSIEDVLESVALSG